MARLSSSPLFLVFIISIANVAIAVLFATPHGVGSGHIHRLYLVHLVHSPGIHISPPRPIIVMALMMTITRMILLVTISITTSRKARESKQIHRGARNQLLEHRKYHLHSNKQMPHIHQQSQKSLGPPITCRHSIPGPTRSLRPCFQRH